MANEVSFQFAYWF